MSFTVQNMLGNQALVTGVDTLGNEGKTVVDTTEWDKLKATMGFDASTEAFDAKVKDFFAPLIEASEEFEAAQKQQAAPDPLSFVVMNEGVEAVSGQPTELIELTRDSIILRAIEEGATDRLVWVDSSTLGVLSAS
jgi:hypothetical protein